VVTVKNSVFWDTAPCGYGDLVRTDVSEECDASKLRVETIHELEITLRVTIRLNHSAKKHYMRKESRRMGYMRNE
jgi:hypothetical protein